MRLISLSFRFATVVISLFLGSAVRAERLAVKSYTTADGLVSDGAILHMTQCSRGFLWVCGALGISRFDGHEFRNYGEHDGLLGNEVDYALETRGGTLWFATPHGVARYMPAATEPKRFITYQLGDRHANRVHALCEDPRGGLWIGTDGGLFHALPAADGLHARLVLRPESVAGKEPPSITPIYSFLSDSHGVLWAATHYAGIYRILADGSVEHYGAVNGLPSNVVGAFLEDHRGRIWMGTPSGLLQLSPSPTPAAPIVLHAFDTSYGIAENTLRGLQETRDGHLWMGSATGLIEFDGKNFRKYTSKNGLPESDIWSLLTDRHGRLWAGTNSSGIMRLVRDGFTTFAESDGIANDRISTIAESLGGTPLAATLLNGHFQMQEWSGGILTAVRPRFPSEVAGFGWGAGQQLLQDHLGEWWIATADGLCRFPRAWSAKELSNVPIRRRYTTRDGLPGNNIYALFEDSRGDIWIGTTFPTHYGLARWKRNGDAIENLSRAPDPAKDSAAVSFVEDRSGAVWISFFGGGLSRYRAGQFTAFRSQDGLPSGEIRLYLDPADQLWGAASAGGVFRLDKRETSHPEYIRYTTGSGMSSNWAIVLTSDRRGRIYAGTLRGIDRIDPATGHIAHLTVADGLANNEIFSAFRDREDSLWFGTARGLSKLTISEDPPAPPPDARLTEVRIDDRPIGISDSGESNVEGLEIRARENHVQISFAGTSLDSALRFQYKLEGSGRDWSPPSPQQTVVYPGFPAGKYRFLVRAVDAEDAFASSAASFSFTVLPPIWQRWWFIIVTCGIVGSAIYEVQRYRIARVIEMERLRTRIATDLHDDIGTSLSHIAVLSELARRSADRLDPGLPEYLLQISGSARDAASAMGDVVWAINPHRDSLNDLVVRMRRFATDVLSAREIEVRFTAPDAAYSRKLESELRRQLFLIFKEAVNNVARHAAASKVDLELRIEQASVLLEIADNGKGFDPEEANTGHGLSSLRSRAARLNGTLSIHSSNGNGTQLKLCVPLSPRGRRKY